MKKLLTLVAFILLLAGTGCSARTDRAEKKDSRPVVAVSFNAMKEFTAAVGGEYINIVSLLPEGAEPHGFQPTPEQMKKIHHARVLVVHGLGMEPWTGNVAQAADNPDLIVVEASRGIDAIPLEEEGNEQRAYDPHAWLSLKCARQEVEHIASALEQADPAHKEIYRRNAEAYKGELEKLRQEYEEKISRLPHKEFVAGHAAFAYLCRDFGLHMNSIESVFAEGEPSARQLTRLLDYCKAHHIRTIFTESGVSPKTSLTLAREIGAQTVPVYTMETSENGKSYLERMRSNLEKIYQHLQ